MPLVDDYLINPDHPHAGYVQNSVLEADFLTNPSIRRPYLDSRGKPCVTVHTGRWTVEKGVRVPIKERRRVVDLLNAGQFDPTWLTANASALRKEQWIMLDSQVIKAARQRLRAFADLAAANTFGGFDGMAKLTLEYEAMSDPGAAVVDFDAQTDARTDSPLFKLRSLPLPITHSDFWFSQRRLKISQNSDTPLDTTMAEACGRRIGETVERTTIGTETGARYGDVTTGPTAHDTGGGLTSTVYGYINFPHRIASTALTQPTKAGWHPQKTVDEVLGLRELLYQANFFGPFMCYHSTDWDQYLDNDYYFNSTGGAGTANLTPSRTLRTRLKEIEGISDVRRLDFLPGATYPFRWIMVQMTADVARAVVGMDVTTVQWPSLGGLRQNFKIMVIHVTQLRSDYNQNTGLLDAIAQP